MKIVTGLFELFWEMREIFSFYKFAKFCRKLQNFPQNTSNILKFSLDLKFSTNFHKLLF